MYPSIIIEIDHAVGILTLNKPARHNAFDEKLIDETTNALLELEAHPQVRVIVLSAAGRNFCAGSDPDWMNRTAGNTGQENLRDARNLARLLHTLYGLSKPSIARVQGSAYGNGVGLVAACDIAIASYDAQFSLPEVRFGMLSAVVTPFVLEAIGQRHGRRYLLSAERFSAAEAYRIGLVHEIVPGEEQLDEAVGEIVGKLLKNGPNAQAEGKALIRSIPWPPIDESVLEDCAQRTLRVRSSAEGREGLAALLEQRKPAWAI